MLIALVCASSRATGILEEIPVTAITAFIGPFSWGYCRLQTRRNTFVCEFIAEDEIMRLDLLKGHFSPFLGQCLIYNKNFMRSAPFPSFPLTICTGFSFAYFNGVNEKFSTNGSSEMLSLDFNQSDAHWTRIWRKSDKFMQYSWNLDPV